MMTPRIRVMLFVLVSLAGASAGALRAQTAQSPTWARCCGTHPWPAPAERAAPGMMGHGMMGHGMNGMMGGSMQRHHRAMMGNIPAAYANLSNPLPLTPVTVDRGEKIYATQCSSCHGGTGAGDGPAAKGMSPPPANLAWLSRMPMGQWDPFMYWTIADGGAAYGTAMPAFKSTLSQDDIWSVVAYIQAHLPAPVTH